LNEKPANTGDHMH